MIFKTGDRVKIKPYDQCENKDANPGWNYRMTDLCGTAQIIKSTHYNVYYLEGDENSWREDWMTFDKATWED